MIIIKILNKLFIGIIFLFVLLLCPSLKEYSLRPINALPISNIYSNLFNVKEINKECSLEIIDKIRYNDGYIIYLYNDMVRCDISGVCVYKNNNELWIMGYDNIIYKYQMLDKVYIKLYEYVYPNTLIAKASYNDFYYYFINEN